MENNSSYILYAWTRWEICETLSLEPLIFYFLSQMPHTYTNKQPVYFPLNNVKHLHKGTKMSHWLKIESVPGQPIIEPLNLTYAWLIHQTTSILLPLPLVNEHTHAHIHPHTHRTGKHMHTWASPPMHTQTQCTQILTGLRMNAQTLPPPSWLIHQTALASWVPEA